MNKKTVSLAALVGGCSLADNAEPQTPGVTIDFPGPKLVVSEDFTSNIFWAVLDTPPTDPVSIDLLVSDPTEALLLSATSLLFTPTNWDRKQFITVMGLDDPIMDGDIDLFITTLPAVSADLDYSGLDAIDVPVINLDNEPVPEPATITLLGMAGLAFAARRRR